MEITVMTKESLSEEPELHQRLTMLEEVRVALIDVLDGASSGPGEAFADKVQWVIASSAFFISLAAIYPVGPGAESLDMSSLLSRIAICAVAMFLAIRMSAGWAESYVKAQGCWGEYISSRLQGYVPLAHAGFQAAKDAGQDGACDAHLLRQWIEVEEIPAVSKRISELLPKAMIRLDD
jgi:hypothetical protein